MEIKNSVIQTCAETVLTSANILINSSNLLADKVEENLAIIASMNVNLEALRSHIVLLQQKLDAYSG